MVAVRLSKSRLMCYMNCPYQFKRYYIDGFQRPPSKHMEWGKKVHESIAKFYQVSKSAGEIRTDFMEPNVLSYLRAFVDREKKRFAEFEMQKIAGSFFPIIVEREFNCKKYNIHGIIDAIFRDQNGLRLTDFKTGGVDAIKIKDVRNELIFYKFLFENSDGIEGKLKIQTIEASFVAMDKRYLFDDKQMTLKGFDVFLGNISSQIDGGVFPKRYNRWCFNCDFRKECNIDRSEAKAL